MGKDIKHKVVRFLQLCCLGSARKPEKKELRKLGEKAQAKPPQKLYLPFLPINLCMLFAFYLFSLQVFTSLLYVTTK